MPKRKVRFAMYKYNVDGHREIAYRGDVIDVSAEEAKRGEALEALVPEDAELELQGDLIPLTTTASTEDIKSYLSSGNVDEIVVQADNLEADQVRELISIEETAPRPRKRLITKLKKLVGETDDEPGGDEPPAPTPAPVPTGDPTPPPSTTSVELTSDISEDDLAAYVDGASLNTIEADLDGQPVELVQRVLQAEQAKAKPRKTVVEKLERLVESASAPVGE